VLARFGDADREQLRETAERVLRQAYLMAPEAMRAALRRMIERDRRIHSYVFVASHLNAIWDERIAHILLQSTKAYRDFPRVFERLLWPLLAHGTKAALRYADSLLGTYPSRPTPEETAIAVIGAGLLLQHTPETGCPEVWKVIERDRAFRKSLIRSLASDRQEGRGWLDRTSERDLGRLFIWMERGFPHGEDTQPDYSGASNARVGFMDLAEFRNTILQGLAQRGTPAAVNAIELVCAEFPEIPRFRYALAGAREALRRDTWIPPSPGELLEVTSDFAKRLVRNDRELLESVVESLERLSERLQGANPVVRSLWNESRSHRRPKDENFFSDVVRDHLEQDLKQQGIVAQREVEIRRLNPDAPVGERSDILVTASSRGHHDEVATARVVIESKECWNSKLRSEMEDQLAKRYLIEQGYRCGLYLIGWFACDAWNDPEDKRRNKVPSWTFEEACKNLAAQARTLSQEGIEIRAFVLDGRLPRV
jgi:hypothetical protein